MAIKNATKATSNVNVPSTHVDIPLSDIYVDPTWNARSDVGQAAGGPEETTGIDGLKMSIATKGQDTPVIVRPKYAHEKFRQPFFLVAGFRRAHAISELAAQNKDPKPTIKAFIRVLTEPEARELNLRENTARENLSGPDLAFGVVKMHEAAKAYGGITQQGIGLALGITQVYVSKLLSIANIKGTIVEDGKTVGILDHWRKSPAKATVEQLFRVSKVEDPAEQSRLYEEFARGKSGGKDGRSYEGKVEQLIKAATRWGVIVGNLVHEDAINVNDDDAFWSVYLSEFIGTIPEEVKAHDKRKIVNAAEEAYSAACENGKPPTKAEEKAAAKEAKAEAEAEAAAKAAKATGKGGKATGKAANGKARHAN